MGSEEKLFPSRLQAWILKFPQSEKEDGKLNIQPKPWYCEFMFNVRRRTSHFRQWKILPMIAGWFTQGITNLRVYGKYPLHLAYSERSSSMVLMGFLSGNEKREFVRRNYMPPPLYYSWSHNWYLFSSHTLPLLNYPHLQLSPLQIWVAWLVMWP